MIARHAHIGLLLAAFFASADPLLQAEPPDDPLVAVNAAASHQASEGSDKAPSVGHEQLTASDAAAVKEALSVLKDVDWSNALPMGDAVMVKMSDGQTLVTSSRGNIGIVGGTVIDLWHRRLINTKRDAQESFLATPETFGIADKDLALYFFGKKKEKPDAYLVIDPLGGEPNTILMQQVIAMRDTHYFAIMLTPILSGRPSVDRAKELWCAKDQAHALALIMNNDETAKLPINETCDFKPVTTAAGFASFLQITRMPYVIRADGVHNHGAPKDLAGFMGRPKFGSAKANQSTDAKE